ncbi:MAG: hypothetical protein ACI9MS_003249 [Glaciecola sp.]|jgi:hypothetical protein
MNTLIAIGLFTATVIVGELRHRYQESLTDNHLERHDY